MSVPVKQCTFAGGEITPQAWARSDLALYEKSVRTLRNMVPMKHGGVTGRPATQYIGTAFNSGNSVRLIPFIFNETGLGQSYVLEFGRYYVAFYQNGASILGLSDTIVTTGFSGGVAFIQTAGTSNFIVGQIITISGVTGSTQFNGTYLISGVGSPGIWHITGLDGSNLPAGNPYISGGVIAIAPFRIGTPYFTAQHIFGLKFDETADVLTLVHPSFAPRELARLGALNWTLTKITNWGSNFSAPTKSGGPIQVSGSAGSGTITNYQVTSVDAIGNESDAGSPNFAFANVSSSGLLGPSTTNPVTLTWDAVPGAVSYRIYAGPGNSNVYGYIAQVSTTTFDDTGSTPDFTNSYPLYVAIFGDDGSGNCPSIVGFSQQRRYFGNTNLNPVGFWGSRPGAYHNFDTHITGRDDDAVIGQIAGSEVNAIEAITELKFMLMLTAGAEIYVQGNGSGVVVPSAINASVQSSYGSSTLRPLKAGDILLFNQALGSKIRDFAFDFAIDGYRGNDITIFAAHLFEGFQIVDWCYQKEPDSIVWAVRSDGVLLSCTYIREQQVLAWAHHDLVQPPSLTFPNIVNGFVENVCTIPENGAYAVYMSVRRVINSQVVRYIERLSSRIWQGPAAAVAVATANATGDPIDAPFADCSAVYDGRNTGSTTMTLTSRAIVITTGVNDQIAIFRALMNFEATIPGGNYSITTMAAAIAAALNAADPGQGYTCIIVGGKFQVGPSNGASIFANNTRSAALTLGFAFNTGYGLTATAPNPPIFTSIPFVTDGKAYQQQLTLTSSVPYFGNGQTAQVGDQIFLQDALWIATQGQQGNQLRCTIQSISDSSDAFVTPSGVVPAEFQNMPITIWARAVQTVSGLAYLAGQNVSIWADRFVVGSPLNLRYKIVYTVPVSGILTLDKPYSVIYVGLPMTQDIDTLDLETYFGETILGRRKRMAGLYGYILNTRSFYAGSENPDTNNQNSSGDSLFQLSPLRTGGGQMTYDQPPPMLTYQDYIITTARWGKFGNIFMRNVDPLPWTLLAVSPKEEDPVQTPYKRV